MATGSILLIDDDAAIRLFVSRVLIGAGYTVSTADSGKTGLDRYRSEPADLVITDLVMPDSEGLETIRAMRRLNPNVKIIAISGKALEFLDIAQKFGAGEILPKPFTPDQLLDTVAKLLA